MGMIKEEAKWLDALVSRNNVAHAYNRDVAMEIVNKTKETYYEMFCQLKNDIDEKWL